MFSARHEFSNEWYRFLHPADEAGVHSLALDLTPERFPFQFKGRHIQLNGAQLFLKLKGEVTDGGRQREVTYDDNRPLAFDLRRGGGGDFPAQFRLADNPLPGASLPFAEPFDNQNESPGAWLIEIDEEQVRSASHDLRQSVNINGVTRERLNPDVFEDIWVVFTYSVGGP